MLTANPVLYSKSKHFEIDLHLIQDKVDHKQLYVVHIRLNSQIAYVLQSLCSMQHSHYFETNSEFLLENTKFEGGYRW
ncbi:hypothetical protein AHAS_Ahas15G0284700 [Arachis hypogaea]